MWPCDGAATSSLPAAKLLAETLDTPSDNMHEYQEKLTSQCLSYNKVHEVLLR